MDEVKSQLRKIVKERLSAIPQEKKQELSYLVCEKILSSVQYKNARAILSYIPLVNELDVSLVNKRALEDKKVLAFPKCVCLSDQPLRNSLDFYVVDAMRPLSSQVVQGFLCKEPDVMRLEKFQPASFNNHMLVLVPGLAFSADGKRLGRGKGYYDGFLNELNEQKLHAYLLGVCFGDQIFEDIPCQSHDMRLNAIVQSPLSKQ